jgi:hypothetical protein
MPDRLLTRAGLVDGVEREGDFDQLLLVGHSAVSRKDRTCAVCDAPRER